jgi:hypothetical protein
MVIEVKTKFIAAMTVATVFLFQSCATIMRGTSQNIPITSNPIGAKVIVDGEEMGSTPLNLRLKRKASHVIQIEKQGYNSFMIRTTSNTSILSTLGNLIPWGYPLGAGLGGFIGLASTEDDEDCQDAFSRMGAGLFIGLFLGWGFAVLVDSRSGANQTLFPKDLNVTLTKIKGQPQPELMLIDAETFQNVKWIRIRCAGSGKEERIELDRKNR